MGPEELKRSKDFSNFRLNSVIDEYIHSARDRQILKRRLIDGIGYERLAEEFGLSVRHTKTIVYRAMDILSRHM